MPEISLLQRLRHLTPGSLSLSQLQQQQDILVVLKARGFAVGAPLEQRILSCTDPLALQRLLVQAATTPGLDGLDAGLT